jgi:hypothetical protein
MSDAATLNEFGDWLVQNQQLKGTPEWNDVSNAFKKLDTDLQSAAQKNQDYQGLSGKIKAFGQGAVVGGAGDFADLVNLNPVSAGIEYLHSKVTGEPYKFDRASKAWERIAGAPEDIAPSARPYYYGGRMTGGGLTTGLATAGVASALGPVATGSNLASRAVQAINADKGGFLRGELAASSGAGAGTMVADTLSPDNATGHLIGGIAGSLAGPGQLLRYATKGAEKVGGGTVAETFRNMVNPEKGAAVNTNKAYTDAALSNLKAQGLPTDPTSVYTETQRLMSDVQNQANNLPGGATTPFLQDETTQGIVTALRQKDPKFGYDITRDTDVAMQNLTNNAVGTLSGDAAQMLEAAKARAADVQGRTGAAFNSARMTADAAAQDAIKAGSSLDVAPAMERTANNALQDQLWQGLFEDKARANDLEALIDNNRAVGSNAARAYYNDMIKKLGVDRQTSLSPGTLDTWKEIINKPDATVGDYRKLLGNLRADQRTFGGGLNANHGSANLAKEYANRLTSTMTNHFKVDGLSEYNQFITQMMDKYRRSPGVVEALASKNTGADNLMKLGTIENILGGSDIAQYQKIENALAAAKDPDAARALLETGQRVQVGQQVLDPVTKMPIPSKIAAAVQKEPQIYEQFPGLHEDMAAASQMASNADQFAQKADQAAARAKTAREASTSDVSKSANFTRQVLGNTEDPTKVIQNAVSSANPVQSLEQLYRTAGKTADGKDGLRAMLRDHILNTSNMSVAADRALAPLNKNGTTLSDWMAARGLLTRDELDLIKENLSAVKTAGEVRGQRIPGIDLQSKVPDAVDVAARMGGAALGGKVSKAAFGRGTLIANQVGSEQIRKMVGRITPRQEEIFKELMRDPKAYAQFLSVAQKVGSKPAAAVTSKGGLPLGVHPAAWLALGNQNAHDRNRKTKGLLN